jgi:hypothetical protein
MLGHSAMAVLSCAFLIFSLPQSRSYTKISNLWNITSTLISHISVLCSLHSDMFSNLTLRPRNIYHLLDPVVYPRTRCTRATTISIYSWLTNTIE